ncbi:5-oxoprolinase subunit PxpA [Geojedonia litorea]|uniref:5-oxoprolinase subunit PxpA n=1 Tax=Geojedonia litorea TaxID=1268269 RepID=A0ABV9N3M5_9FLAO
MQKLIIDINCDVGEGLNNEHLLMPYVSSCNIACGGHAGDPDTMRAVVRLAKEHQVKIGAHPSFPDKENFGRQIIEMSCADLYTSLKQQIRDLMTVLREEHLMLHHIKPHGALYNLAARDERTANVVVEVVKSIALPVYLYAPYKSVLAEVAEKEHIEVTYEAFADRNYNKDLTLVSRAKTNAIIENLDLMFEHVQNMIFNQKVKTVDGVEVVVKAETFCVHGDNPKAVKLLEGLSQKLKEHHVLIR